MVFAGIIKTFFAAYSADGTAAKKRICRPFGLQILFCFRGYFHSPVSFSFAFLQESKHGQAVLLNALVR